MCEPENSDCAVCKNVIGNDDPAIYHARLGVWVHFGCPKTNVCGEDITMHTVMLVNFDKIQEEK